MLDPTLTTGLPALDQVLKGLLPGDNIVWQVDAVEEYQEWVEPFGRAAIRNGKRLIYFRFARHQSLLSAGKGIEVHELDPEQGFETFIATIHSVIDQAGPGVFYVFDCLSRLAADWCSDQMLANFFMLTCPYLYDLETVTYFALYRNYHTSHAIGPIQATTQLFLDTYRHKGDLYVRPVKVQHRYSPTMHMLHVWHGDSFRAVTASAVISEILTLSQWSGLASDSSIGFWETSFIRARELIQSGEYRPDLPGRGKDVFETLIKMIISRDPGMQRLISRYLTLQDILDVRKRMIGTGLIGGKTVGMLLSRAIVKKADRRFVEEMEEHDSFFVGSDVFYDFLVRCGVWWIRQKQRNPETFLEGAEQARRRIITGEFPPYILRQFEEMLDYFGQSPFIVRSSSLLEDNYGHSFAGKYESVYCANQGPRERRMQDLLAAIRTIYASSMSEKALSYRADRGMLDRDEQMALLVMRVSGAMYGRNFYPQMAGVGFSFNPYAWAPEIDPKAGVIRLVFGLGTRAVNRSDDDYTRIVALNAPEKRPETNFDEVAQYAQRRMDYLDLEANQLVSDYFTDVVTGDEDFPIEMFASEDAAPSARGGKPHRILTFDSLLARTGFVKDLREILHVLQVAYNHPVDIEFTANFVGDGRYKINLLQCRPLQVQGAALVEMPDVKVGREDLIIAARGAVIGQSRLNRIDRLVYVSPDLYSRLPVQDRHEVARLLGEINRARGAAGGPCRAGVETVMLLGPGRWGSGSPHLGIPVTFSEINRASILCEIVAMHENLVPDVSLGTHFLNELVERNILYLALFPQQGENFLNKEFFEKTPSRLLEIVPGAGKMKEVVRVLDAAQIGGGAIIKIMADAVRQRVLVYFERD
ncbi:MAG TPA: PEP/pyruvate-binding domain-containing protein [Kiritimatiellia bacterium]|nr:PEP/pyruvate-binding domain-containing protein [Kiritimatiellia bacterium]HRZ11378.1 PEP/pyruvate-binding domain-containing protein [Kiritimatiellia bacterium]HSA17071.1 PEP/pyruvate-binding domain-containing protein [Kiritimatiellia bacterium]